MPLLRKLLLNIESLIVSMLSILGIAVRVGRSPFRTDSRTTVLLKTWGGIGDFLLLLRYLPDFRRCFPDGRIVLIARRSVEDIAVESAGLDGLFLVNYQMLRGGVVERLRLWWMLTGLRSGIYINLDYSPTNEKYDRMVLRWLSGWTRIAFRTDEEGRDDTRYDRLVEAGSKLEFEPERYLKMLHRLGAPVPRRSNILLPSVDPDAIRDPDIRAVFGTRFFLVCPGSLMEEKRWHAAKFARTIDALSIDAGTPVLCGARDDYPIADTISKMTSVRVINLAGRTSLLELAALMQRALVVISNDSAPAHLAAAVRAPVVVLLGGGHFGRFFPYPEENSTTIITADQYRECFGCSWQCKYDSLKCLTEISVDAVVQAARTIVAGHTTK
jgi:ADP-heptose:LPS heptosyltransferase